MSESQQKNVEVEMNITNSTGIAAKVMGDDLISIVDVEEGSIKIILKGSEEGLRKIQELFESGELTEVEGFPVEYVRSLTEAENQKVEAKSQLVQDILSQRANESNLSGADLSWADLRNTKISQETKLDDKWRLIWEIVNQGAESRNLSSIDLSYANLQYAQLQQSNLIGTNLSYTQLNHANLTDANLSGANLNNANLEDANLSGTIFHYATLENARFGYNRGISDYIKRDLIQRGAFFVDDPGSRDRSKVLA